LRKYLTLFMMSWQKQLEVRSDFIFERGRSLAVLFSLYYLWSSLLTSRTDVAGYSREQMLTYVLMMTLLRAFVLSAVTDRIPSEIAQGKLSEHLLRPLSHIGFWATQDAASKMLNLGSFVIEMAVFIAIVRPPLLPPPGAAAAGVFALSALLAMEMYFRLSYMLGVLGFWTAQSWGPRFCFEILLEFSAGAYFPVDLLPAAAQRAINLLPFPYLVFHPLSIYLGKAGPEAWSGILAHQVLWIVALTILSRALWSVGLRRYAAEGG
jgi:ABC-2 type transport system permease protein